MHAREPKQPLYETPGILRPQGPISPMIREVRSVFTGFVVQGGVWQRRRPAGSFVPRLE